MKLQQLLEPFGITRFYTDGWGAYQRHIAAEQHHVGKENTQKIESKHINLRTRIKRLMRRTICFSKTEQMHDLVIGLFIPTATLECIAKICSCKMAVLQGLITRLMSV